MWYISSQSRRSGAEAELAAPGVLPSSAVSSVSALAARRRFLPLDEPCGAVGPISRLPVGATPEMAGARSLGSVLGRGMRCGGSAGSNSLWALSARDGRPLFFFAVGCVVALDGCTGCSWFCGGKVVVPLGGRGNSGT